MVCLFVYLFRSAALSLLSSASGKSLQSTSLRIWIQVIPNLKSTWLRNWPETWASPPLWVEIHIKSSSRSYEGQLHWQCHEKSITNAFVHVVFLVDEQREHLYRGGNKGEISEWSTLNNTVTFRLCPAMPNTDLYLTDPLFQNVQCMSCNSYLKVNSKQFLINLQSHLQKVSLYKQTNTLTITVNHSFP